MSSPKIELQKAIVALLKADTTLRGLIGNPVKVFEQVPSPAPFPYVVISDAQQLPDKAECIDGSEIFIDLHVWSRATSDSEREAIAFAIEDVLDEAAITMTNHRCLVFERDNIIFRRDGDTSTRHAILTFRALTEPSN